MSEEKIKEVPDADRIRQWASQRMPALAPLFKNAKIIDDSQIKDCSFVVCGNKSYFTDDVWTMCAFCCTPVCHRPYVPAGSKPPKICIECLGKEDVRKKFNEESEK